MLNHAMASEDLSTAELARRLATSRRRIQRWRDHGCKDAADLFRALQACGYTLTLTIKKGSDTVSAQ